MKDARRARSGAPTDRAAPEAGLATRRIALEILRRVDADRAFADVLLGHRVGDLANPADVFLLAAHGGIIRSQCKLFPGP